MTDEKEKDWYNSMDANELIIFWVKVVGYFLLSILVIGIVLYIINNNKNSQIDKIKSRPGFVACEKLKQVNNKFMTNHTKCSCYLDKLQNNIIACTDEKNILFNI